jgi:hypothetical protein
LERQPGDIDVANKVRHVVRGSPRRRTGGDHDRVHLTKSLGARELLDQEPVHFVR